MALNKWDLANLRRLQKCIAPTERRIANLKAKLSKITVETLEEIKRHEESIASYKKMVEELEALNTGDSTTDREVIGGVERSNTLIESEFSNPLKSTNEVPFEESTSEEEDLTYPIV